MRCWELKAAATFSPSLAFAFQPRPVKWMGLSSELLLVALMPLPLSGQWDTGSSSPHCAGHYYTETLTTLPTTQFTLFPPSQSQTIHPSASEISSFHPSLASILTLSPLTRPPSPLSGPGQRLLGSSGPAVPAASCRLSSTRPAAASCEQLIHRAKESFSTPHRNRCNL